MNEPKKTTLNLDMFSGVNHFAGLDRNNLIVDGDVFSYVPSDVKILWFRSVNAKGIIKTQMVGSLEDIARHKLCVFSAEVYDSENKLLAMGYGSASADEEGFIGNAERRAVGKALTHAGFTWHNGDFSVDMDVANTFLNLYNSYINNGTFDIHDIQVTQMYDDALVTVLPEGYGADTGKPIAAMDQIHLEKIAKNYAMIDSGNALVNAKIKFVYMYQMLQTEIDRKNEDTVLTPEELTDAVIEKEQKSKKTRRSKKTKEPAETESIAEEPEESKSIADIERSEIEEEQVTSADAKKMEIKNIPTAAPVLAVEDESVAADHTVEQEAMSEPFGLTDGDAEEVADDGDYNAEKLADVFDFVSQNEDETVESEMPEQGIGEGFYIDESEEEPPFFESDDEDYATGEFEIDDFNFDDAAAEAISDSDDFDIQSDFQRENHKEKVLKSWGYKTETDLTSNWKAHLDRVRDKFYGLSKSGADELTMKEFVENIPIFDNFLWKEKANKNAIVLLGDFMTEHEEAVREVIKNGVSIPANTVKAYMEWYIAHVWDEF